MRSVEEVVLNNYPRHYCLLSRDSCVCSKGGLQQQKCLVLIWTNSIPPNNDIWKYRFCSSISSTQTENKYFHWKTGWKISDTDTNSCVWHTDVCVHVWERKKERKWVGKEEEESISEHQNRSSYTFFKKQLNNQTTVNVYFQGKVLRLHCLALPKAFAVGCDASPARCSRFAGLEASARVN